MRRSTLLGCLAAVLAFSGELAAQSSNPVPGSANLHARYVILGAFDTSTVAYARAIIDPGFTCPTISGGTRAIAMTSRENPHAFPVVVCEALLDFGQTRTLELADASLPLPTVKANPTTIHVFGDSGCKSTSCPPGSPAEPFASLAAAAASSPPDLVLHMGDANYRGTPSHIMFTQLGGTPRQDPHWTYDAGDGISSDQACGQSPGTTFYSQNEANSNFADNWASWRDDFFIPAADLLARAPWVVARGNHELCSRAGPGWFYFLDQSSNLTGSQLSCPAPDPNAAPLDNVVLGEPYAVDLGTINIIVLDSANACDAFTNPYVQPRYDKQIARLPELAAIGKTSWLIHHRPLWGVTQFTEDKSTSCTAPASSAPAPGPYGCINQTLQTAVATELGGELPTGIKLVLSGHMHRFQSITFPGKTRPPQIIIGNSGVGLDTGSPVGTFNTDIAGERGVVETTNNEVSANGESYPAFGFLEITYREDGTWNGRVRNISHFTGFELATCSDPPAGDSVCTLAPGVSAN